MLEITPEGPYLSEDAARKLDDEFYLSHPFAYFCSRIGEILGGVGHVSGTSGKAYDEFVAALGLDESADFLPFDERDREMQASVDAMALRQHAAEALLRLLHGLVVASPRDGDARSTWVAIADGPNSLHAVIRSLGERFAEDEYLFLKLFVPKGTEITQQVSDAALNALAWVNHAIELLSDEALANQAAHNKVKHGLAVRTRDDERLELVATTPNPDGTIPLSAFGPGKSLPIFDRPFLTYLYRPYVKPPVGLEVAYLRVSTPHVLAETWMMAVVYAAVFHNAAIRHFDGRDASGVAKYPTLPIGATPERVLNNQVLGLRNSITTPPDGKRPPRPSGIFFPASFLPISIDFSSKFSGRIVEG